MISHHEVVFSDFKDFDSNMMGDVDLVVTSPPYPMIEMWDQIFSLLNPDIDHALKCEDGRHAYHLMNQELDKIWEKVDTVIAPGGIVCINIGDATRKIGNKFQLYPNHSHITKIFQDMGYQILPLIIWRKESNKPNKFMGSGMTPPNAYVTLEHEYILIFRKKGPRKFNNKANNNRRESSYFWEERNSWFSDIWQDLKGIKQKIGKVSLRDRAAAFPLELPYRLINMFSIQGDMILDPFLGTGTTTIAAAISARNSIGYEIDKNFAEIIERRIQEVPSLSQKIINQRLKSHKEFADQWIKSGKEFKYRSKNYDFGVISRSEEHINFPIARNVLKSMERKFRISYD